MHIAIIFDSYNGHTEKMATAMARAMVTEYGMSDKLGPLAYGDNEEEIFLGHSVARTQSMSDDTLKLVDDEIHRIVEEGYATAEKICKKHIKQLHIIAEGLLEYETLSGDEIKALLKGKQPIRDYDDDDSGTRTAASAVPSTGRAKQARRKKGGEPGAGMEPQPS